MTKRTSSKEYGVDYTQGYDADCPADISKTLG
jgi:hypothetical protein